MEQSINLAVIGALDWVMRPPKLLSQWIHLIFLIHNVTN